MLEQLEAEIEAIRSQIELLQQERASLTVEGVSLEGDSPAAIAAAYRRQARETAQVSAEVKGIDDAIAALEMQVNQKQADWERWQKRSPIEQQVEEGRQRAHVHAERINQIAGELADELKALKTIADEISPRYWQVYYKPFITGFNSVSVPYIRSDGDVWTIINRMI